MFKNFFNGLKKTKDQFKEKIDYLVTGYKVLDDDFYEELEEILISSDIGVRTAMSLVDDLKKSAKDRKISEPSEIIKVLVNEVESILNKNDNSLKFKNELNIVLVVGVNGVGKTTTIGKLASKYKKEGFRVGLGAADTFRAGAIEQLSIWGERTDVEVFKNSPGSDPAAVVYDSIKGAKEKDLNLLIIDTAGRLHNNKNLMDEISKIRRVIERENGRGPDEIILVLDGSTGQNAISQGVEFKKVLGEITGIIVTKLDGTSKGGVIIPIISELGISVKFIGLGEGVDDLQVFNNRDFLDSIFEENNIEAI